MDSSSYSSSNENNNNIEYTSFYDYDYISPPSSIAMSESSNDDYFAFYDNNSSLATSDSCYAESDNYSADFRFYEDTDSSYDGERTPSYTTTTSRSTPDSSLKSSSLGMKGSLNILHRVPRPVGGGILKASRPLLENNNTNDMGETKITHETIEKLRESELEDVLQYARDIIKPHPQAKRTYSTQPAKVVQGSFRHMLSVKELSSKTGAFKYRTISMQRNLDDEIGISVRKGDGWEKDEGIYISRVSLGSVFDQYEVLQVGDEIVQVNKVDVKKMSADDVIRLMHIPEKLSVTVKMLTPFSKKRVEQSSINALKFKNLNNGLQKPKYTPSAALVSKSRESLFKVAHLQIGNEKRNTYTAQQQKKSKNRLNNINNNNNNETINKEQQKTVKISPYRSMEGGKSVPPKQCLSPIREFSVTSSRSPSPFRRKQSYVRWFDES